MIGKYIISTLNSPIITPYYYGVFLLRIFQIAEMLKSKMHSPLPRTTDGASATGLEMHATDIKVNKNESINRSSPQEIYSIILSKTRNIPNPGHRQRMKRELQQSSLAADMSDRIIIELDARTMERCGVSYLYTESPPNLQKV